MAGLDNLVLGTAIAFSCAIIAVAVDLQDAVKAQLGALANTSILLCWQGWASLAGWGLFDAAMYHIVLHNQEWATHTFGFKVDQNQLWTALVVGVSAIIIIRSKLAKVGSFEVGGEWLYLWSRAHVLDAVNTRRIDTKDLWQGRFRPIVTDAAAYPNFFTDLEARLRGLLPGRPDIAGAVTAEIDDVRKQYVPAGDPNPDATINANLKARGYLVSIALDYFGHAELAGWAQRSGIPI